MSRMWVQITGSSWTGGSCGCYAVFDQIWTSPDFRRQGLDTDHAVLGSLALEHDVETGLLAGLEGQALYLPRLTAIGDVVARPSGG